MAKSLKLTWFTIASNDDEHPLNVDELKNHCETWFCIHHNKGKDATHPHWHFVGKLPYNSRTYPEYIGKWGDVPAHMVCKVISKLGIVNYLNHQDEEDKEQYDNSDIQTNYKDSNGNSSVEAWMSKERDKKAYDEYAEIIERISNFEITEYNIEQFVEPLMYVHHKTDFDRMFQYMNKKYAGVDREMEVWYVCGKSGSGKTTLAKFIPKSQGMATYVASSGKNPFDEYRGEPCVIMDDMRPSDMKFNEFLKLTDNNTASAVGCRYYNKQFYRCKLLIITNCEPLETWYTNLQESQAEAKEQIFRRFSRIINVKGIFMNCIHAKDILNGQSFVVHCPEFAKRESKIDISSFAEVLPSDKQIDINEEQLPW